MRKLELQKLSSEHLKKTRARENGWRNLFCMPIANVSFFVEQSFGYFFQSFRGVLRGRINAINLFFLSFFFILLFNNIKFVLYFLFIFFICFSTCHPTSTLIQKLYTAPYHQTSVVFDVHVWVFHYGHHYSSNYPDP